MIASACAAVYWMEGKAIEEVAAVSADFWPKRVVLCLAINRTRPAMRRAPFVAYAAISIFVKALRSRTCVPVLMLATRLRLIALCARIAR